MKSGPKRPDYLRVRRAVVVLALAALLAPARAAGPRFYPDDPLRRDNDTALDASGARPIELSEAFDFLENMFADRGERKNVRASNVNTVDEVPDSSWFTNRIGVREMPIDEIVRGPDSFDRLEVDQWVIVSDKGDAGFQPGFRAVDAKRPGQVFQFEVDVEDYPDLSSASELIGTALYHAIGYHVVDSYIVNVDPDRISIAPDATMKDASGRRRYRRGDLDDVLKAAARNPDGTYRMSAGRFVEGAPLGNFRHFGTRPDDPNDIHPHEHRRELRANRVFGAWLNHDDSRALNTLDMLVPEGNHKAIRHYMFDFGSLLGNTPDRRGSGSRVSDREAFDAQHHALVRSLGAALAVRRLSGRSPALCRPVRRRSLRARRVEARIPEYLLRQPAP